MRGDSAWTRHPWWRRASLVHRRTSRLPPQVRGLMWSVVAGLLFVVLNTVMRGLSLQLNPYQTHFMRYLAGLFVMLPFVARSGIRAYWPRNVGGQFTRG